MYLLAVSGGPDSMYLLYKYRHKKIMVAHINYHLREDSNHDEQIVRDFCAKYQIPCEVLNVTSQPHKNLQNGARKIRYDFFVKVAQKYKIKKLLVAHHKDDFLETALMQQKSQRTPNYFGIKKYNQLFGLQIIRPFLHKITKREIERFLHQHHIQYAVDSSNLKTDYTRNKIRAELKMMLPSEAKKYYEGFKISNKILVKKNRKIEALYKKGQKTQFSTDFFNAQTKLQNELIFTFVHKNFPNVKLSTNKIRGIIDFIASPENNKSFVLNNHFAIKKDHYHLRW